MIKYGSMVLTSLSEMKTKCSLPRSVRYVAVAAITFISLIALSTIGSSLNRGSFRKHQDLQLHPVHRNCSNWDLRHDMDSSRCCDKCRFSGVMPQIRGFWHVAFVKDGRWRPIVQSQLQALADSYLSCTSQGIAMVAVGDSGNLRNLPNLEAPLTMEWAGPDVEQWEYPTLERLQGLCFEDPTALVWYIHNKGGRYREGDPVVAGIETWRHFLEHFALHHHGACVSALLEEGFDTCGANLKTLPFLHYSGNFWWARCDYVNRLLDIKEVRKTKDRMFAEQWLLGADHTGPAGKARNFISMDMDYGSTFPESAYLSQPLSEFCPPA